MGSRERTIEPEIYFLIHKFLRNGPCKRAAKAIEEEIEQYQLLPKRLKWTGHHTNITLSQYEKNYPHVSNDYLLKICSRIGPILDKTIPPSVPGIASLLGDGTQSLLRTTSVIIPKNPVHLRYARLHNAPLLRPRRKAHNPGNIVNILSAREACGNFSLTQTISTKIFSKQQMHKRYLGHLSSVYCILFDRTGKYIFTGADDLLIKIWGANSGRLLATLRGHSAEITDIAVNYENTLLASGSCDKMIRVWSLRTTEPICILTSHSNMVTSLKFCPVSRDDKRFLISTSTDGSVCFWRWSALTHQFDPKPIKYIEKMKQSAQIVCSSFSAGGCFLAVGSTDHFVRVYHLTAPQGPTKVLEIEVHSDQVDSIQFCNFGLRFVSGSKDGTAHIWSFERQTWKSISLNISESLPGAPPVEETEHKVVKIRANMVCWTCDDLYVITAVNDKSLKIWESRTGKLKYVLNQHEDEVFVLEVHPTDPRIFLSGGHDGKIILWDITLGEPIKVFFNQIEGQGHGAIFDCKFSPDGLTFASTDSHGHLTIYGFGTKDKYERVPNDVFFHTDYRPLIRDSNHYVIDEQTQCAPHLMPPPFLVDIDGNPYPPALQRLVPGRENCKDDQLIPYIAVQNDRGIAEVLQPVSRNMEENQVPIMNNNNSNAQAIQFSPSLNHRPTIDDMIERLAQEQRSQAARERVNVEHGYAVTGRYRGPNSSGAARSVGRGSSDSLGVRQSIGNWQSREKMSTLPMGGRLVVEPLRCGMLSKLMALFAGCGKFEEEYYERELRKKPLTVPIVEETKHDERFTRRKRRMQQQRRALNAKVRPRELRPEITDYDHPIELSSDELSSDTGSEAESWSEDLDSESESESDIEDSDSDGLYRRVNGDLPTRSSDRIAKKPHKYIKNISERSSDWFQECRDLLDEMWEMEDSSPFRNPVDPVVYPDYNTVIDTPMSLSNIREELSSHNYKTPLEFQKDMKLIFENSRTYNTNKKSKIFGMNLRLSAMFNERMKIILDKYRARNAKRGSGNKKYGLRNGKKRKTNLRKSLRKRKRKEVIDLGQPSTSGVSSASQSSKGKGKGKEKKKTHTEETKINGVTNGRDVTFYQKLVESETDIDTAVSDHQDSETEIDDKNDSDATEIAEDEYDDDALGKRKWGLGKIGRKKMRILSDEDDTDSKKVNGDILNGRKCLRKGEIEDICAQCGKKEEEISGEETINWIMCESCLEWYHQVCVGVNVKQQKVGKYFCLKCKEKDR